MPPIIPFLVLVAAPVGAIEVPVVRQSLSNGLPVLLHEDRSAPLVTYQVFVRCGSRNEVPGITGMAHLFEHMMFNGSARFPPKSFDRLLEAAGGTSNGYTWKDVTSFMESFPPAALDLVLDMEADRMHTLALTPENLEQERGIVAEERRYSSDNDNDGLMEELRDSLLYRASSYRDPVIGWMPDIQGIRLEDAQAWYGRCYQPANALVVMTGDFSSAQVLPKLEKTLGALPAGAPVAPPRWSEPEPLGMRYAELSRPTGQARVQVAWVGPPAKDPDQPAMELLDHLLSDGRASLLVDKLVYEREVLVDVQTWLDPLDQASTLVVDATLADGVAPLDAVDAIDAVMSELRNNPLSVERLERARRQATMDLYRRMETTEQKADILGTYELHFGGYEAILARPDRWAEITPEALAGVATRWLAPDRRVVVALYPEVEDPTDEETPEVGGGQ